MRKICCQNLGGGGGIKDPCLLEAYNLDMEQGNMACQSRDIALLFSDKKLLTSFCYQRVFGATTFVVQLKEISDE